MSVWVVVASKYGSAREVAEAVAEELRDAAEVEVGGACTCSQATPDPRPQPAG